MGKKYIIELEEAPFIQHFKNGAWETIYRVKGFNSLVFDWNGLNMLTPYTEPDLNAIRKEAYDKGCETAKHECEQCRKVRADAEQELAEKAYQRGLNDAWEAARKIASDDAGRKYSIFGQHFTTEILNTHSAAEALEEIRAHEQAQKEKEEQEEKDSVTVEEVMRQYLDAFCKGQSCTGCPLHTSNFTCGRGYHFLNENCVSDEEVRKAYTTVLQKMRETK